MNLNDYLKSHKIRREEFATQIETSPAYLSQIIYRHRFPSLKLVSRIIKATQGKVTLADLRPEKL